MPVAIALIVGVTVMAVVLIGFLWATFWLLPYYLYIAIAVYLMDRSNRKHAQLSARIGRESEIQKGLNAQEARAWQRALENDGNEQR